LVADRQTAHPVAGGIAMLHHAVRYPPAEEDAVAVVAVRLTMRNRRALRPAARVVPLASVIQTRRVLHHNILTALIADAVAVEIADRARFDQYALSIH